jgi:hypothetical protein
MKTKLIITMLSGLLGLGGTELAAAAFGANALEPYINEAVSASGLHITQAEKDKVTGSSKGGETTVTETSSDC